MSKQGAWNDSPVHPIIDQANEYVVLRFDYHNNPDDGRNSYIDLTLGREQKTRRLRFLRPQSLKIEVGFPMPTHGMIILDIRHRNWDGLNIEVADFEASPGSITFYAQDVVDLDFPDKSLHAN